MEPRKLLEALNVAERLTDTTRHSVVSGKITLAAELSAK